LGDFSTTDQAGFSVSGFLQGAPYGSTLIWRGEIAYSGFSAKNGAPSDNLTSFLGSVLVPLQSANPSGPYIIGGIGLHHMSFSGVVSENDFGFNFGGGVRFQAGDMATFVEVRYHYIATSGVSTQILPITFGVVF